MAENVGPNLDLEQILATLASLQKPEGTTDSEGQQTYETYQHTHAPQDVSLQYPPQTSNVYHATADPRLAARHAPQQRPEPSRSQPRPSAPMIDPSTIIEWKQGLRCVSKIANQNPDFAPTIRKLMKEQEGNIKQWEAGRKRVIDDHKVKRENEQTNRAALSLPGLLENTPLLRTPEREHEELTQYDAKVYRACKAMFESQASSLKSLGVPFFGVKANLILHESEEEMESEVATVGGKITKGRLLELQRKMLDYLVELYGD